MDHTEEKHLIERAKNDPKALGEIFEKHYSPLLNYCLKRTGSLQISQDITSEVFFIVVRKIWQFKWRDIPFSAWLYRIANNEIAHYYRKNKYKPISLEVVLTEDHWEPVSDVDLEEEFKEVEKAVEMHEEFLGLQKLLFTLPIKYQEVLVLRYFENKKIKEMSEILGKKENTLKSLLKRGLEMLEEKVRQQKLMQPIFNFILSEDEPS